MIFRSTFHLSTARGLESHPGRVLIDGDQILFQADGELVWNPIMNTSGLSESAREVVIDAFRLGEIQALQADIRATVRSLNDQLKGARSNKRAIIDVDEHNDITRVELVVMTGVI